MKYEYQSEISQLSDWEKLIIPIIDKNERKNFNTLLQEVQTATTTLESNL